MLVLVGAACLQVDACMLNLHNKTLSQDDVYALVDDVVKTPPHNGFYLLVEYLRLQVRILNIPQYWLCWFLFLVLCCAAQHFITATPQQGFQEQRTNAIIFRKLVNTY